MLYVLGSPDGRVALLRLPDLDSVSRRRDRTHLLANRTRRGGDVAGVPLEAVVVLGACGQCGEVYEYEAAERLVEGEGVASDRLARPPEQGVRAVSDWYATPEDWLDRCHREDVGWFPVARQLAELRDRGYLPRPRYPSDPRGAYAAVTALVPAITTAPKDRAWVSAVVAASYDPTNTAT